MFILNDSVSIFILIFEILAVLLHTHSRDRFTSLMYKIKKRHFKITKFGRIEITKR